MSASPLDLDELLAGVSELIDAHEEEREDDPGEGNFNCEGCNACYNCRFCEGCDSCEDCTYCTDCVDSVGCTQSKRCVSCVKGSYLEDCRGCENSRYLALCVDCKDCLHCLACVGLEGAEYHVLNEKVSKKEFYKMLNRMREDLDGRLERGWRPEVIGLQSVELDDDEPEEELEHDEEAEAFLRRPKREPVVEEDSGLWDDPPPRRASRPARGSPSRGARAEDQQGDSDVWAAPPSNPSRASGLSRGRAPEGRGAPPRSTRPDSPGRPSAGARAKDAEARERPGSASSLGTSSGTSSVGRRPLRGRGAPKQESDVGAGSEVEGTPDPFGDESLGLGQLSPSRPDSANRDKAPVSSPKKRTGGLKRGRRPPRKA